jgi:hypothetical protein
MLLLDEFKKKMVVKMRNEEDLEGVVTNGG